MVIAEALQRRGRDSNPGTSKLVNGFRDRPDRPLRHLSVDCQCDASGMLSQLVMQRYYFFLN